MDDTTKEKLAVNAANAWKMASNWVMAAAGLLWGAYLSLPIVCDKAAAIACTSQADVQVWAIATLHVPPPAIALITAAIGIAARLWPQKSITPNVASAKSDSEQQP